MTTTQATIRTQVPVKIGNGAMTLMTTFSHLSDPQEHLAIIFENQGGEKVPLVRLHSECLTGDVFGSQRCDCGDQLAELVERLTAEGGILLYMRQEGRGIGLYKKLDAYKLQIEQGLNTFEANRHLGEASDARDYTAAAEMLKALGVFRIRLLSNNPDKKAQLEKNGIEVVAMLPTISHLHPDNINYLKAKQNAGHLVKV